MSSARTCLGFEVSSQGIAIGGLFDFGHVMEASGHTSAAARHIGEVPEHTSAAARHVGEPPEHTSPTVRHVGGPHGHTSAVVRHVMEAVILTGESEAVAWQMKFKT